MTPEEIIDAYNVLSQDIQSNAATEAARIGNAQRSLGTLAARVASPSGQTSGLANYTYNRTLRPAVDTTAAALVTQGKAQAMNTYLNNKLLEAKAAYEDAKNNYQVASTKASTAAAQAAQRQYTTKTDVAFDGRDNNANAAKGTVVDISENEDGKWTVTVANGNGGYDTYDYNAKNAEDARSQYFHNFNLDGTKKTGADKYIDTYTRNPITPLQQIMDKLNNKTITG